MASKRMFSLEICDTDRFLDMSVSAQCLYFHIGLRSDDDGFCESPKRIMRSIGASESDLKELVDAGYLIRFETGTVLVTHFKGVNAIKKDRYRATACPEVSQVVFDGFKWILKPVSKTEPTCIQGGDKTEPTCIQGGSVDKNSIDKNSIDKIRLDKVSIDSGEGQGRKERGAGGRKETKTPSLDDKFQELERIIEER